MVIWLINHITMRKLIFALPSRFPTHAAPAHAADILLQARMIACQAGLRYVYLGNTCDLPDAETT